MTTEKIPIDDWGKDHWSLLGYLETRVVETLKDSPSCGEINRAQIRCNVERHGHLFSGLLEDVGKRWHTKYGTRLRGFFREGQDNDLGRQLAHHDDWDCLDDMEAAGLIEVLSEINGYIRMTDDGHTVAGQLRDHLGRGGTFACFEPNLEGLDLAPED